MGVLLLGPHMITVIIGFNERGSQGEMVRCGTISYNWVKVWKCLTPQNNTSAPCYDARGCHMLSVCIESDIFVCCHPAALPCKRYIEASSLNLQGIYRMMNFY